MLSEVVEVRSRGRCGPASGVDRAPAPHLRPPCLLPVARRARRGQASRSSEIASVCDRLVVDSSEWLDRRAGLRAADRALRAGRRLRPRLAAHASLARAARRAAGRGSAASRGCGSTARAATRCSSPAGCARACAARSALTRRARRDGRRRLGRRRAGAPPRSARARRGSDLLSAELDTLAARPGVRGGARRRRADRARRGAAGCQGVAATTASSSVRVEMPVRRDRAAAVDPALAREVRERAAGLLDDRLHRGEIPRRDADRVDGAVDRALGDEHVPPEVAVARGCARPASASAGQRLLEREGQHRVLDPVDRRHVHLVAVDVRTAAALRPPAAVQRRRADDAELHDSRRPRARRASPRRGSRAGSSGCRRSGR